MLITQGLKIYCHQSPYPLLEILDPTKVYTASYFIMILGSVVVIFRHERSEGWSSPQARLKNKSEMHESNTQRKHKGF